MLIINWLGQSQLSLLIAKEAEKNLLKMHSSLANYQGMYKNINRLQLKAFLMVSFH